MSDAPELALTYALYIDTGFVGAVPCEACGRTDGWHVSEFEPDGETPRWYTCICGQRHIRAERVVAAAAGDGVDTLLEEAWVDVEIGLGHSIRRLATGCGCPRCQKEALGLSQWLQQGKS